VFIRRDNRDFKVRFTMAVIIEENNNPAWAARTNEPIAILGSRPRMDGSVFAERPEAAKVRKNTQLFKEL